MIKLRESSGGFENKNKHLLVDKNIKYYERMNNAKLNKEGKNNKSSPNYSK